MPENTTGRKRAIIYCRVSTDRQEQDGASLEYQEEKCLQYAELHDIEVITVLKEAKSGFIHYSHREKLSIARQFVRDKLADAIIVWDLRRFSRNFVHSSMIFEEIESAGGEIISVSENIDNSLTGKLIRSILAWSAESEREKIVEYANRHWQTRLEHNMPIATGKAPYGWQWGDEDKTKYVIDKENAATRLSIFTMFVEEDMSLRGIAHKLTEDGILPPYSSRNTESKSIIWRPSTIHKLITASENIGILQIGKTNSVMADKGNKIRKPNPNMKAIPGGIPAIVGVDMYEMAQRKLKSNQVDKSHLHRNPEDFLLKSHIFCKTCNYRMNGHYITNERSPFPYPLYRCSNEGNKYSKCPAPSYLGTDKVDSIVWENCCRVFERLDLIRDTIESNIQQSVQNILEDTKGKELIDQLREEVLFAKEERNKFQEGSYYYNLISSDIHDKETKLARHEEEFQESHNIVKLSNVYRQRILGFLEFLTSMQGRYHEATFSEKRNALAMLGVQVYIHADTYETPEPIVIDTEEEWLTVKGAARLTGIKTRTLRSYIDRGSLAVSIRTRPLKVIHRDEVIHYFKTKRPNIDVELGEGTWFTINKLSKLGIVHHGAVNKAIADGSIEAHVQEVSNPFIHRDELNRWMRETPIRTKSERENNIEPRIEIQYSPIFTGVQPSLK